MKSAALLAAAIVLASCSPAASSGAGDAERAPTATAGTASTAASSTASTASAGAAASSDIQTIDNADTRPAVMDPPPTLTDEGGAAPKATAGIIQSDAPPPPTPADEAFRASLPFAPAIGLDPVDGSKISIRAATPAWEYKGRTFYFSNEENKRTFMAKPDAYLKGVFATH